jgi:riboflavin-specific deaminase-like protein
LINCAISLDGKLAFAGGRRARLSSEEDMARVHRLRAECDGILVGSGTVLMDDPSLGVDWAKAGIRPGRPPTRIVLDSRGRLPAGSRVFVGSQPTLVATVRTNLRRYLGADVVRTQGKRVDWRELFSLLSQRKFRRVLVEGGAEVLTTLLATNLWDRLTIYVAPVLIGGTTAPSLIAGPDSPDESRLLRLSLTKVEKLGPGSLLTLEPSAPPSP